MTANLEASLATSSVAEKELQARMREADNARRALNNGPGKDKDQKLREACEGFESVFIQKMWEGMRATLPKEGIMHSRDEKFWQGMYDQELGKSMAKSGGIGLADMMVSQLSRDLQDAGSVAASSRGRKPMDIQPAPLVAPQPAPQAAKSAPPVAVAPPAAIPTDIYSGTAEQPTVAEAAPPSTPVDSALEDLQVVITRTIKATTNAPSGIPVLPPDHPVVSGRQTAKETTTAKTNTEAVTPYSAPVQSSWQPSTQKIKKPRSRTVQPESMQNAQPAGRTVSSKRMRLTPEAILTAGPELANHQAAQATGKTLPTAAQVHSQNAADLIKEQYSGQSAAGAAARGNS